MDYNRPLSSSSSNPKVHVAMVLVPGVHSGPKNYSKSPLLLNPGGPGGSGTTFALMVGSAIQKIVGYDQDIIGFDPRGIGATTPRADCFSIPSTDSVPESFNDEDYARGYFHRLMWDSAARDIGTVNSSIDSLTKLDNRARAVAKLCQNKDSLYGADSILKHVSTPAVARDMLSIIDAWDEWTGSQRSANNKAEEDVEISPDQSDRAYSLDTKGKLVYWGFSYGTLLGATFAAMFPDRVGRVVLDGVVDADHYVAPVWVGSSKYILNLRSKEVGASNFNPQLSSSGSENAL
jgi:pimeloyl-ACP methyl ester carboxylesterase